MHQDLVLSFFASKQIQHIGGLAIQEGSARKHNHRHRGSGNLVPGKPACWVRCGWFSYRMELSGKADGRLSIRRCSIPSNLLIGSFFKHFGSINLHLHYHSGIISASWRPNYSPLVTYWPSRVLRHLLRHLRNCRRCLILIRWSHRWYQAFQNLSMAPPLRV